MDVRVKPEQRGTACWWVHARVNKDIVIGACYVLHAAELAGRVCLIEQIVWPYSPERFRLIVEGGVHHPGHTLLDQSKVKADGLTCTRRTLNHWGGN